MGQSFASNTPTLTTSWKTNRNKPTPYEEKLTACLIAILEFGGRVEGLKEKIKRSAGLKGSISESDQCDQI